jgi:catechol 2,3-dioxygenase-like lactoylglutathione lyase family enzyme
MRVMTKQGPIKVRDVITLIAVSDIEKSKDWYTRLFGKGPDLEPFPGNVEFKVGGAWVQIHRGKVKPSTWSLQIGVEDLARERERLLEARVPAPEIQTSPKVISWFDLTDPDGNPLRLFQVLTSDPKVTGDRV